MTKKRIYNPKTRKYYTVRQKTTSKGKKGQILSSYRQKTAKAISRRFGGAIKRLGKT